MKKNELVTIKGLDTKELKEKVLSLRKEIADLVLDKNMRKLKDLKMIFKKRKDLAKILTIMKQKDLLQELELKVQKDSERLREPGKSESQKIRHSDTPKLRSSETPSSSENSKVRVKKGAKK